MFASLAAGKLLDGRLHEPRGNAAQHPVGCEQSLSELRPFPFPP